MKLFGYNLFGHTPEKSEKHTKKLTVLNTPAQCIDFYALQNGFERDFKSATELLYRHKKSPIVTVSFPLEYLLVNTKNVCIPHIINKFEAAKENASSQSFPRLGQRSTTGTQNLDYYGMPATKERLKSQRDAIACSSYAAVN